MNIFEWKKSTRKHIHNGGLMLYVTEGEAISIINSLTSQMINESCNSGREEYFLNDGREFSIAVNDEKARSKE
jgi:hypothetical protein